MDGAPLGGAFYIWGVDGAPLGGAFYIWRVDGSPLGGAVEGARCTEKGRVMCAQGHRVPNGDTIEFSEHAPLQVRKDTLAIAFYKRVIPAASPIIASA